MADDEVYENHIALDSHFPIFFHELQLSPLPTPSYAFNWHEDIELLYFADGPADVQCGSRTVRAEQGDTVIANSGELHLVRPLDGCPTRYYCLIVSPKLFAEYGLPEDFLFPMLIHDTAVGTRMETVRREMADRPPYYKGTVRTEVMAILLRLARLHGNQRLPLSAADRKREASVKAAIAYMNAHYAEPISTRDICRSVGFSLCYFAHEFKAFTGMTVLEYLNFIRCKQAFRLLSENQHSVQTCAELCGFSSPSYFARIYRRWFGVSPSASLPSHRHVVTDFSKIKTESDRPRSSYHIFLSE